MLTDNQISVARSRWWQCIHLLGLYMKTHESDAILQQKGCGALQNLAVNADNKVSIAQQRRGITAILNAMTTHLSDAVFAGNWVWRIVEFGQKQ